MEAIYHGVPMVGMPVFIDQVDVLARIEDKRIGVGLDKWASSDEVRLAIKRVLNDGRCVTVTKYLVVCLIQDNKMYLLNFEDEAFDMICLKFTDFTKM